MIWLFAVTIFEILVFVGLLFPWTVMQCDALESI